MQLEIGGEGWETDWPDHIETLSATAMKTKAGQLGNKWKTDSNTINGGYPILKWQEQE